MHVAILRLAAELEGCSVSKPHQLEAMMTAVEQELFSERFSWSMSFVELLKGTGSFLDCNTPVQTPPTIFPQQLTMVDLVESVPADQVDTFGF